RPFAPAIKQLVVLLAEGQGRGRVRDDVDPHLAAAQALVLMVAYLGLESLIATSAPPLGADEPALRERWKEAAVRLVLDGVAAHWSSSTYGCENEALMTNGWAYNWSVSTVDRV